MELQRFIARFSAPGFHDSSEIFAEDIFAAARRAIEMSRTPYAEWPAVGTANINVEVVPYSGSPVRLDARGKIIQTPEKKAE